MTSTNVGSAKSGGRSAMGHRGPSHSLAPEHLGEAAGVAVVVVAIGGVAILIGGVAMAAAGLTMGSHFSGSTPPPNLPSLGYGQVLGGTLLAVLGVLLAGSAAALLGDLPRSRPITIAAAAVTALLAAAGAVLLAGEQRQDPILLSALVLAFALFAASAAVLVRTRR